VSTCGDHGPLYSSKGNIKKTIVLHPLESSGWSGASAGVGQRDELASLASCQRRRLFASLRNFVPVDLVRGRSSIVLTPCSSK
jgi:hypothetical protein